MTNLLLFVGTALLVMTTKSASTVITFASVGSIQQEGNAMADLARAIPGLTTLSDPGKTAWSSTAVIWSGRRNLVESDNMSTAIGKSDEADTTQHRLLTGDPPWCSYVGVTCYFGSVAQIILLSLSLVGSIPNSISSLTSLMILAFYNNGLTGTIPSSIGSLTSLQYLFLQNNFLVSTIPSSLGSLTSLVYLLLDHNSLTGTIPSSIGLLKSLVELYFNRNSLSGTIPSSLGSLTSLLFLYLDTNYLLSGTIPSSIGSLTSLQFLEFGSNRLNGTIPSSIGLLTSLQQLYLDTNSLVGTIPSSIGSLTSLTILGLYGNSLTGTIPSSIGSLRSLTTLALHHNSLVGTIPSSTGSLKSLVHLILDHNRLAGTIPSSFSKLTLMSGLYLDVNYLTMGSATTVPNSTFSHATLSGSIDLSGNCLAFHYGSISVNVTHCAPTSAPTFVPTSAPTSAPTFVPTSAPTLIPTVSPTVFIASTLPIVSYLSTASLSSTQITLTAHLSRVHTAPNDFSGETLYCIGMNNGSAPSTIGSIKSAATDGSTSYGATAIIPGKSSYPLNLNVTFTGLVALQSYAVYCYVESSTGVGSSLTAVLSSKTVVRTLCCKVFKYLNSPSSMYGAYSKRIGSSPSLYVFTYTLSAAPSVAIKVTPLLYLNSLINTEVTAIPSSAVYSSTSLLTGSFILLANANINGSFVIVLSAGGSSAAEYYNHSITLQILSSVSPLPAPAMKSCQFSDSGQAVVVTFNTPTDSAGIATATWPCSNLFSFISASLTTCSWTTVATVTMTFNIKSGNIYLAPGGTVTVLGGLLRSFCSYNAVTCAQNDPSPSANLITMAPNIPTTPVVVLNSPVSLGSCANLVLDATASYGNGGRPYTSIQWIVSARSSAASIDTTTISTYLNSFSSRYQVSTPITILAQNLTKASYMITLNLRNFLGMTSFATVTITVITDSNLPSLSIIGPAYRTMVASSPLKVLSVATLSSCASGALPVIFVWTVKEGNRTAITNIKSSSLDPSIFAIPSYGLVVNNVYTVTVTALTHASTVNVSTTVYVAHGVVTAVIAGGTYRSAPVDKVLQLDATGSYDSDYPQTSSSMLTYQWSCSKQSPLKEFGTACHLNMSSTNTAIFTLPQGTIVMNTVYAFTVVVRSKDRRSNSRTVIVSPTNSTAQLSITSSISRFNPSAKLVLDATISANYAVDFTWSVLTVLGAPLDIPSLTNKLISFPGSTELSAISFPLSVIGGSFTPGKAYTFQLSVSSIEDAANTIYSQITLTANSAPTSGRIVSSPTNGSALVTQFIVSSPGWTTDAASFPLSYAFSYRMFSASANLTIAVSSVRPYTTTLLPSGEIILLTQVTDIYFTSAVATTNVAVTSAPALNFVSHILNVSLATAFAAGNINLAIQTVNNVALTLNVVNCSSSPVCNSLNRKSCLLTAGTCSSCHEGYTGVLGDSNSKCLKVNGTSARLPGAPCISNSDCLYALCQHKVCTVPLLCPTNTLGTVCSGNGACRYSDPSGNSLYNCTILTVTCSASCSCNSGFGGQDCSLDSAAFLARDDLRSSLCQALVDIAAKQDGSSSLLNTLASSLLSSFAPSDVISASGRAVCAEVLQKVSSLSNRGFLAGNAQLLADLVSVFTVQGIFAAYGTYNGSDSVYNVSRAVSSLVQGVQLGMASGEVPVSLVTPNVQLSVTSTLIFASNNIVLTTPATASQSAYGSIQPKVTLGPQGLNDCDALSEYAHLSVLQWSINPYANSTAIKTPMLRLAYTKQVVGSDSQRYSRKLSQNSASFSLTGNPAYYVALQFSSGLKFDFLAYSDDQAPDTRGRYNYTVPACKLYNGVEYVSCEKCNVSSYTDYSVTYSCYDIFKLCPASAGRRRLADDESSRSPAYPLSYGAVIQSVSAEFSDVLSSNPFKLDLIVLTFMGSLCGCIIIILIYLLKKDHNEKLYKRYVKSEADNLARKLLKDEIKKGGNDDLGKSFQTQVKSLNLSIKSVKSFSSTLSRTFSGRADNHCRDRGATFLGVNFDFDERDSDEFDSECGDERIVNEGEDSNFGFENVYSGGDSVNYSTKVAQAGIETGQMGGKRNSKNEIRNDSEETKSAEQSRTAAVVTEFLFRLFPGRSIFIKKKNLWGIVGVQHKYLSMFAASTVTQTRTIRFFNLLSLILTSIFADTVFFGIFYPAHSTCTSMTNKANCELSPSRIQSGSSECHWSKDDRLCSLRPPPNDPVFIILVALLTTILSIPILLLFNFLLNGYASNYPGSRRLDDEVGEEEEIDSTNASKKSSTRNTTTSEILRNSTSTSAFGMKLRKGLPAGDTVDYRSMNITSQNSYIAFATPFEESMTIMDRARSYLSTANHENHPLSWSVSHITDMGGRERAAKIKEIEEHLGILPDGNLVPLTLRQKYFFKDSLSKLIYKIQKVRRDCLEIVEVIESFQPWEYDIKNTRLIRHFILECLSPFKRKTLEFTNATYDEYPTGRPSWSTYIGSWIFISATLIFFIYWIFAWGMYQGGDTLSAWGKVYGTTAATDILLVQVTKIYILYYLPSQAMQPQLIRIRKVLADISMNYINKDDVSDLYHKNKVILPTGSSKFKNDLRNQICVVQHMSAACRAAWSHELKDLPSAWLLRQISDLDVSRCREGRLDYLGSASFILIAGLMSCLMVNESNGDAFINAAMPSFFSSTYLLANVLYNISLLAILCPSGVVLGIFLYHRLVYRRAKKSHKERKILLQMRKRSGDFGRGEKLLRQNTYKELNRRPRGMAYGLGYFIRRLLVSINDGIVTFIAHVSEKRLKRRVAADIAHSSSWCAMNKPALHQGTMHSNLGRFSISVIRLEVGYNGKDSVTDVHNLVRKRKIVPNPPEIMRMVKASHMWWTAHDGQSKPILGSPVRQLSITAQSSCQSLRSEYPLARRSRRVLRATIFFDTGEALLRILSNLLTPAVYEEGMDHDWKVELFEVPASALLEELQNIFETFYPDGIPMSEVEKKEACELFRKWTLGQDSSQSSGTKCSDSHMVSFKAFHGWFYDMSEMIHNSMSDRLLTHILLLTHRSSATSADAVKLLNVVAPKHSNTIHNTYISARPTPVVAPPVKAMYTENYYFGCPLLSRHWYNPRGHDSIQDIDCESDDNDLYSTYAQSSLGGQLSDSIYPLNNLGGSPRNFTYPQKIHGVNKGDDLYSTYPEGDLVENATPFSHSHSSPKGILHNYRGLRYPLRKTTRNHINSHAPH